MDLSSLYLSIDDRKPEIEDFECFESGFEYSYDENQTFHSIKTQLNTSYFWLYSAYGRASPRSEKVFNVQDCSHYENPRKSIEIEQVNQLFMIYIFNTDELYISSLNQKGFVKKILEYKMKKDINIKSVFTDIDEFCTTISKISTISFVSQKKNLFSNMGTLQQTLTDRYYMEEPEEFKVVASYNTRFSYNMKMAIKNMIQIKDEENLKQIIIQGIDDQGFSKIFNEGSFVKKISINLKTNEQGMFTEEEVKNLILNQLGYNNA